VTLERERDAEPLVIFDAGCCPAPSSIPAMNASAAGAPGTTRASKEGASPRIPAGPGRPFHSCGVARRIDATAAARHSSHFPGDEVADAPICPWSMVRIESPQSLDPVAMATLSRFSSAEIPEPSTR
jgi:hypothetical protein